MCGIVGCLALAIDADPDGAWVAGATQRISHRGPGGRRPPGPGEKIGPIALGWETAQTGVR